jgi:hypothetical protein
VDSFLLSYVLSFHPILDHSLIILNPSCHVSWIRIFATNYEICWDMLNAVALRPSRDCSQTPRSRAHGAHALHKFRTITNL